MYVVIHDFDGPNQKPGYEKHEDLHTALDRVMFFATCTCKSHPMIFNLSEDSGIAWSGSYWSPVSPEVKLEWFKRLRIT